MPIYEYKCEDCQNIFELLSLSAQDDTPVICSKCNSGKVTKLMSAGSIRSNSGATSPSAAAPGCAGNSGFS